MENFVKYQHHERDAWVRDDLKGKHREHCLCYSCEKFKPGDDDWKNNCPIANLIYSVCIAQRVLLPVWECEKFVEKPKTHVHVKEWGGFKIGEEVLLYDKDDIRKVKIIDFDFEFKKGVVTVFLKDDYVPFPRSIDKIRHLPIKFPKSKISEMPDYIKNVTV
jgi:hypothetical protein